MGNCISSKEKSTTTTTTKTKFKFNHILIKPKTINKKSSDIKPINTSALTRAKFITDLKKVKDLDPEDKVVILRDSLV
jgi:hypothetical protein